MKRAGPIPRLIAREAEEELSADLTRDAMAP